MICPSAYISTFFKKMDKDHPSSWTFIPFCKSWQQTAASSRSLSRDFTRHLSPTFVLLFQLHFCHLIWQKLWKENYPQTTSNARRLHLPKGLFIRYSALCAACIHSIHCLSFPRFRWKLPLNFTFFDSIRFSVRGLSILPGKIHGNFHRSGASPPWVTYNWNHRFISACCMHMAAYEKHKREAKRHQWEVPVGLKGPLWIP